MVSCSLLFSSIGLAADKLYQFEAAGQTIKALLLVAKLAKPKGLFIVFSEPGAMVEDPNFTGPLQKKLARGYFSTLVLALPEIEPLQAKDISSLLRQIKSKLSDYQQFMVIAVGQASVPVLSAVKSSDDKHIKAMIMISALARNNDKQPWQALKDISIPVFDIRAEHDYETVTQGWSARSEMIKHGPYRSVIIESADPHYSHLISSLSKRIRGFFTIT